MMNYLKQAVLMFVLSCFLIYWVMFGGVIIHRLDLPNYYYALWLFSDALFFIWVDIRARRQREPSNGEIIDAMYEGS